MEVQSGVGRCRRLRVGISYTDPGGELDPPEELKPDGQH